MIAKKKKQSIKSILKLGGVPGYFLLGYQVVQAVFARGKIDAAAIDGSAVIFMLYSFSCLGVGWHYLFNKRTAMKNFEKRFFTDTPIIWFVLYTALGFISAIWSMEYRLTIYRSIESIAMLFIMMATLKVLHTKGIHIVIQWSIYYVFSIIVVRFLQYFLNGASLDFAIGSGGVFECVQMVAPVFFFLGVYHARNWYVRWAFIIFSVLSMSTTGYIGMALGLVSLVFGNTRSKVFATMIGVVLMLLVMMVGADTLLKNTVFIEKPDMDMKHTTGRDQIWERGYEWFKEKPLTGYGFTAGETYLIRASKGLQIIGMHNAIMSALVGEGVFGVVFIVLFFVSMFKITLSKYIPIKYRPALIAIFLSAFVQSMGNPGIGFRVYGSWMSAMYVCVLIASIYVQNKYYKRRPLKFRSLDNTAIENKQVGTN